MTGGDFFWLLQQQQDAKEVVSGRAEAQQGSAAKLPCCRAEEPSPPAESVSEATERTEAHALLRALASGAADVPAFLQGQGFAQDAAGAGLQAACSEALLAVLATPPVAEHQDYAAGGALQSATAVHSVTELTERLLELGAAVHHVRQQDGMTPLVAALAAGQLEAAGMLLDAGAHADPPAHTTALAIAAAAAGPSAGPVNNKRRRREAATAGGSAEVAPSIGQQASSVTVQPTPLVLAVAADSAQLVSRLLAAGADVNRQCTMQLAGSQVGSQVALTPLIAAVNLGSAPLVHQLLEAGADLHQKCIAPGSSGVEFTSALSSAVLQGSQEMAQLLVAAGACSGRGVATQVGQDHPALRAVALAAQRGRVDLLDLLYLPLARALHGGSAAMLGTLKRRTALHPLAAAAERGQLAAVERLLVLGAPVNHEGSVWGGVVQTTPLMLAAANGHLPVVECLLAAGACPLKTNGREEMAAALALQRGQLAVVRRLLDHTGEAAQPVDAGSQAIEAAAAVAGAGAAAQPAGAANRQRLQLGNASKAWQLGFATGVLSRLRPLSLGALEQERQRYQLLLQALLDAHTAGAGSSSEAAARVRQLATPASLAHAAAGSEALLDSLLSCGISSSCVDPTNGSFPLLAACHLGWPPMQRLLARGASVNQAGPGGSTALMLMAARPAMLSTAQQLLSWAAWRQKQKQQQQLGQQEQPQPGEQQLGPLLDPGLRNAEGRDALGVAFAANNRRSAEALLEHLVAMQQLQASAAPAGPAGGAVPGAAAAVAAALSILIEVGPKCLADINLPGRDGRHPLVSQVQTANRKQLRLLLSVPGLDVNARDAATGRTPLMLAVARQQPLLVDEILATGRADVQARDASGCSAVLLAARASDGVILRQLLDAGADADCCDNGGDTPLMALARLGQHKLLWELLGVRRAGTASINVQDAHGLTALHYAAAAGSQGACQVLRSCGADPCLPTQEGQSAANLAEAGGHTACLPLLRPQAALAVQAPAAIVEQKAPHPAQSSMQAHNL